MSCAELTGDFISQSAAAIIGVVAALIGTYAMERARDKRELRKDAAALNDKQNRIAHRVMFALEAQRVFAQAMRDMTGKHSDPLQWAAVRFNRQSVPTIDLGELDFLFTQAQNQNILPKLLSQQQNFDQLIDSLAHLADARRDYESALLTASPLKGMYKNEVDGISKSLLLMLDQILSGYGLAQTVLLGGIRDTLKDFVPIFRV